MDAIKHTILEKVRQQLADDAERQKSHKGNAAGNTERYDRVLALWVDLQRAMQFCWGNEAREAVVTPWDCEDMRVRKAWVALTHPRNEVALEILTCQLPEGEQLEPVQKALQECRKRCANA